MLEPAAGSDEGHVSDPHATNTRLAAELAEGREAWQQAARVIRRERLARWAGAVAGDVREETMRARLIPATRAAVAAIEQSNARRAAHVAEIRALRRKLAAAARATQAMAYLTVVDDANVSRLMATAKRSAVVLERDALVRMLRDAGQRLALTWRCA